MGLREARHRTDRHTTHVEFGRRFSIPILRQESSDQRSIATNREHAANQQDRNALDAAAPAKGESHGREREAGSGNYAEMEPKHKRWESWHQGHLEEGPRCEFEPQGRRTTYGIEAQKGHVTGIFHHNEQGPFRS